MLRNFQTKILPLYAKANRFSDITKFYSNNSEITAGVLIIGDEILKGQVEDKNSSYLIKNLNHMGIKLTKLVILPDDISVISKEIEQLSSICSVVITSGGIGPTHDDVTFAAVAKACGDNLELNKELCELFCNYFGTTPEKNPAIIKFATIPKSAKLNFGFNKHDGTKTRFPLISINNIYLFPGVPKLLDKGFKIFKYNFNLYNKPKFTKNIYLNIDEFKFTPLLNQAVEKFKSITFGSYPSFHHNYYKVCVIMESFNSKSLDEVLAFFEENLPKESIISLNDDFLTSADNQVYGLSEKMPYVHTSLHVIEEALRNFDLSEICLCFNGGKDCTALLHLVYAVVKKIQPNSWPKLHVLYVKNEPFKEMEDFIQETVKNYNLNLIRIEGNLIDAFTQFLNKNKKIKAVFLGTRRIDPGAQDLNFFTKTDSNWPPAMRVLPLLEWTYNDIWSFIRTLKIPYCILYDQGYTSIGEKSKTIRNPSLIYYNDKGYCFYKPAYLLTSINEERNTRSV